MKVAIGGLHHETNTFNIKPTDLDSFRTGIGLLVSQYDIVSHLRNTGTVMGGFIAAASECGFELVPTFYAQAGYDTGTVNQGAFDYLEGELLSALSGAHADGILLHLHGAMVTEKYDDPEAEVLKKVRESIGDKIPIVLVHDLHGNISKSWLEYADAIIGYKTAPHKDEFERGVEGGKLMMQILKGFVKPTMALEKPRILIGGGLMTVVDQPLAMVKPPMYRLMSLARKIEQSDRVLNVTVAGGFGHADVPRAGMGIVVTTNGDQELAEAKASELSGLAWDLREDFLPDKVLVSMEVAMKEALANADGPVVMADEGDNVAGGGPGDATHVLKALKEASWPDATLIIRDHEAVHEALRAGIGSEVNLQVGGKSGKLHGEPVELRGAVKALSNGIYVDPRQKTVVNMGNACVLRSGETDVLLTERTPLQANPGPFRSMGIDPIAKRIIVLKSAHAFRLDFERFAKLILEVDTPGVTSPNVSRFNYRKLTRPIYPLDPM